MKTEKERFQVEVKLQEEKIRELSKDNTRT